MTTVVVEGRTAETAGGRSIRTVTDAKEGFATFSAKFSKNFVLTL